MDPADHPPGLESPPVRSHDIEASDFNHRKVAKAGCHARGPLPAEGPGAGGGAGGSELVASAGAGAVAFARTPGVTAAAGAAAAAGLAAGAPEAGALAVGCSGFGAGAGAGAERGVPAGPGAGTSWRGNAAAGTGALRKLENRGVPCAGAGARGDPAAAGAIAGAADCAASASMSLQYVAYTEDGVDIQQCTVQMQASRPEALFDTVGQW